MADHRSFQSAFQQDENSGSTEDAKAPIKTVFVPRAQYGPSGARRDRELFCKNVLRRELVTCFLKTPTSSFPFPQRPGLSSSDDERKDLMKGGKVLLG